MTSGSTTSGSGAGGLPAEGPGAAMSAAERSAPASGSGAQPGGASASSSDRAAEQPGQARDPRAAAETGQDSAAEGEAAPPPRHTWSPAVITAAVALCLAVAAAVLCLGGSSDPTPGDDSPEAGFARDMIVHHQQAVEMSFIVRDRTDDEEVRTLAYDIANTQANQRGMMLGWLDLWDLTPTTGKDPMAWMGHQHDEPRDGALMPGMATRSQLAELRQAEGKEAEVLFLTLMIDHHRGGVDMAEGAVDLVDTEQVDDLAQGMVDGQQAEIELMNGMLKERGAEPVR